MRAFISRCRALGRDMSLEFLDGYTIHLKNFLVIIIQRRARDTMKPHLHSYVWLVPVTTLYSYAVACMLLALPIPRAGFGLASRASNNGIRKRLYPYVHVRLRKVRVLIVPYIHASAVALSCAGIGALLLRCRELLCHVSILARIVARGPMSGWNYLGFAAKTQ